MHGTVQLRHRTSSAPRRRPSVTPPLWRGASAVAKPSNSPQHGQLGWTRGERGRFHATGQAVPRRRAVIGIHALLDHGWTPDTLATRLTAREIRSAQTGAAVLDYRVSALVDQSGIDLAIYEPPAPLSAEQEWLRAAARLRSAQVNHLATASPGRLRDERAAAAQQLALSVDDDSRRVFHERLALAGAALARQLDRAATRLAVEPPVYLVGLLGPQPDDPRLAAQWRHRALAIEHYRHHVLGLSYGTPAAADGAPAAYRAIGPAPA